MRISGGGGNFLSPRNEGLENGTAKPCHSEARSAVRIALPQPLADMNFSEGSIQTLTTMRSSRRFAPQDDMILNDSSLRKAAFTLAEVLITLGIIGIVAAMTLPAFISNVQGRIQAKRVENINQKLSKVTDKMAVQSGLIGYPDTMAFVQEMKKHMSIAKVCDNSHLAECWGTTEVDVGKDKPWEIAKTKTAKTLKIGEPDNWADTVGIVTADGTPMILSYDKECNFDVNNTGLNFDKSSGKSNSLACISGVFDWNGGAKPNKLGDDVLMLGMASDLGNSCAFEVNGTCYTAPFTPTPLTFAECEAQKVGLGIKECCSTYHCNNRDYWAGAVKKCKIDGMRLPTHAELDEIAKALYPNQTIKSTGKTKNLTYTVGTATSLGLPELRILLWSSEELDEHFARLREYYPTRSEWASYVRDLSSQYATALCVAN